jgi:hypothetical protein
MTKPRDHKQALSPAIDLDGAYRSLAAELDSTALFRAYYVERPESPVRKLKAMVEASGPAWHALYLGQQKSGKTTELLRLAHELKDEFFVVFISVTRELEPSDVKPLDLLLIMATKLADEALSKRVDVGKDIQQDLQDWLVQVSGETFLTAVKEKQLAGGAGVKLKPLIFELDAGFKTSAVIRDEVRKKLEPRVADLVQRFDTLCDKVEQQTGRPPLVLIDDLEKIDLKAQENVFFSHVATVTRPNCRIIYGASKSLCYLPLWSRLRGSYDACEELRSVRTVNRDGTENQDGLNLLREIILQRVDARLFAAKALDKLIRVGNGIFADLLEAARAACLDAKIEGKPAITWDMVDRHFVSLSSQFSRMIPPGAYATLASIHNSRSADPSEMLSKLLFMQAVIEYEDEKGVYYDVHPAVAELLKLRQQRKS